MSQTPPSVTCREFVEFLADYLDRSLPVIQATEFERHLQQCPACRRYVEAYRQTIALERLALTPEDSPVRGTVPESLVKAVLAAKAKR